MESKLQKMIDNTDEMSAPDKAWAKIYELASVPAGGPSNREERRRVEKVLARLKKRGLTVS